MSHFEELRKHKELINLRESARYSWREELSEGKDEHPYVEVMPNEKTGEEKKSSKKEEKKEEVKEGVLDAALEADKKMGELHKKVDKDVERMKKGKKFKEEFKLTPNTQFREGAAQDGPAPTAKQRKGAMDNIRQNINSLQNTEDERKLSRKERDALAFQKARAKAWGMKEELSIDDQMRISREHNRKSKEEKLAANKAALGNTKKVAPKKDTRTGAQKMTDATGPRPGSRYRGD